MFNSIYHDLLCPDKKEISKKTEIQIKWQEPQARTLNVYYQGDMLEDIEDEYNNNWIRTDYICNVCSQYTQGSKRGLSYIKVDDQSWHYVFIRIEQAKIREILTEEEFKHRGISKFVKYW